MKPRIIGLLWVFLGVVAPAYAIREVTPAPPTLRYERAFTAGGTLAFDYPDSWSVDEETEDFVVLVTYPLDERGMAAVGEVAVIISPFFDAPTMHRVFGLDVSAPLNEVLDAVVEVFLESGAISASESAVIVELETRFVARATADVDDLGVSHFFLLKEEAGYVVFSVLATEDQTIINIESALLPMIASVQFTP